MSSLTITRVEAFDDNYIWLIHGNKRGSEKNVIIVDPGDEDPVIDTLNNNGLTPSAIFITHHHGDHTGGILELTKKYQIPVYGPANERIPELTHALSENDKVELLELGLSFDVYDVPGHTIGHIAYLGHSSLFIGDTLFAGGCGRLFEGTPAQMQDSLAKLLNFADDTEVFCAHEYTMANLTFAIRVEPKNQILIDRIAATKTLRSENQATVPSLLKLEKQTNPFLRFYEQTVIDAAEGFAARKMSDPVDVFKTVRYWKDTLD